MIGRHDIIFRSESPAQVMEGAKRIICADWDEAIVENAETGEILDSHSVNYVKMPDELLIYKNAAAQASWQADGAIPENENLMVHVLCGNASLTIVVDDPNAPDMSRIVDAIRDHVYQDIFWIRADAA